MATSADQAIEKLTIVYTVVGSDKAEVAARSYTRASDEQAASVTKSATATQQMERQLLAVARAYNDTARASQQIVSANDNTSESWHSTAVEVASLASHLKAAALALYVFSPAFRAAVNPAVTAAAAAALPAAFSATAATIRALLPHLSSALAFLSRISAPILAVAGAWTVLNSIIDQGSNLLEKYGTASRSLDSASMKSNLESLTKLQQQDSTVTAEQARRAAELNTRLEDAKFRLGEILKVQYNVNDAALALQGIWVNIVELVTKYADKLPSGPPADPAFERALEEASAGRSMGEQGAPAVDRSIEKAKELAEAYRRARGEISATLGTRAAAGGDPDALIGGTFTARWNAAIDALAKGADKAKQETKEVRGEFDRLIESMERRRAAQEADALSIGKGAGEVERLRTEFRLLEAAQQDIAKNGGQLSDYAARIKTASDRAAEAAHNFEKARVASQISFQSKTLFLSPEDVQIAQQLRGIYGNDIPAALASSEAEALRFHNRMREARDTAREIGAELMKSVVHSLMEGKNVAEGLSQTLKSLSGRLADKAIEQLLSGEWQKAAISGISAVATYIGSVLLNNDQEKKLDEARKKWWAMSQQLQNFINTAEGFDMSGPAAALRQLYDTGVELAKAAHAAGDMAGLASVVQSFVKGMNRIVEEFANPAIGLSDSAQRIKAANDNAKGLIQTLTDIGQLDPGKLNQINTGLGKITQSIRDDLAASLQARINDAQGLGFVNDISRLIAESQTLTAEGNASAELIAEMFNAELQAIVDRLSPEEFQKFAQTFPDLSQDVRQATDDIRELQDQINQTASSIVDYINDLMGGSQSTLSPTQTLSNAQSAYNANLVLAQAGNLDAQNRFVELARNLEQAARAVFGSAQGYQDIRSLIIAQGLGLPAVGASTDPVVNALTNVLTAIQAGNTIASGNAQAIANLLLPTMGNSLTFDQFSQFLTGNALSTIDSVTRDRLQTIFNELDTNGNQQIDKQEAIRAASVGTQSSTASINAIGYANPTSTTWSTKDTLTAIEALQVTSTGILQTLRDAFVATGVTIQAQPTVPGSVVSADPVITALRKIVYNTAVIAYNTAFERPTTITTGNVGTFAMGGIAQPGQSIIYGEHHPQGPFYGRVGAEPVAVTPNMPWGSNDNVVAELRALREEVAHLRRDTRAGHEGSARHVGEKVDDLREAIEESGDNSRRQSRQQERAKRVA